MFGPEFYPTPVSVIDQMNIDCYDKIVLEPSAGKGDIVNYCLAAGALKVYACEKDKDLAKLVSYKAQLLSSDFFNIISEQVVDVQIIIMNPPFSNADKHILHAWSIAPEGCEIIALCNYETLSNDRGWGRSELSSLISNYGEAQNLGDCFSKGAERSTEVNIGLIKLFKPVVSKNFNWEGLYFTNDHELQTNSLLKYNDIRAIVNTYVAAVNCFDEVQEVGNRLNSLCGIDIIKIGFVRDENLITREQFSREFQIRSWKKVFDKFNIEKFLTKNVLKKVNLLSASRKNYPFTMKNIYKVIEIIIGTAEGNLNDSIVEAVDNFTRHTHENRFGVEGWKTNESHLLNRKFIVGWIAEQGYGNKDGLRIKDYQCSNYDYISDLTKAMCYITGRDYDNIIPIRYASCRGVYIDKKGLVTERSNTINDDNFIPNSWYDWGFFEFKVFKKGSGHFRFKNEDDWARLNQAYAKIKGLSLPEKIKSK